MFHLNTYQMIFIHGNQKYTEDINLRGYYYTGCQLKKGSEIARKRI